MDRQAFFLKVLRAGTTGATVTAINFASLWVLVHFFGPRVSFSAAFFVALAAHFVLSKYWTFRDRSAAWRRQIPQYLIVAGISYLIQFGIFHTALSVFGVQVFIANAAAIVVGSISGFLLMHAWVFDTTETP